jgi:hypothetical protein
MSARGCQLQLITLHVELHAHAAVMRCQPWGTKTETDDLQHSCCWSSSWSCSHVMMNLVHATYQACHAI